MTDFPADILQLATTTVSKISSRMEASPTLGAAATEVIAEALMARDERAAQMVERRTKLMQELAATSARVVLEALPSAIRSGEQP